MAEAPVTLAVVMACYNRRETTLRCLRSLTRQASDAIHIEVHLLDDASPDGSADAVRAEFPNAHVIEGDGKQFWGGGMHLAMQSAIALPFEFLLWLNDDVELKDNALEILLSAYGDATSIAGGGAHCIVGAVEEKGTGKITYTGFRSRSTWHPVRLEQVPPKPGSLARCDTMNGNCVLLPAEAVRRTGTVDPTYVQQLGDIDYGYRLVESGIAIWVASETVGSCPVNDKPKPWRARGLTIANRLRLLHSPLGFPLGPWLHFLQRRAGWIGFVLFGWMYIRISVTELFLRSRTS